jgi:hypothetical protein
VGSRSSREISESLELAERIVRVQGNLFIKELLRKKRRTDPTVKIGVTKDEIVQNLTAGIESGRITRDDLDAWIREVEGWGRQHVYLYRVSTRLSKDPIWSSPAVLQRRLRKSAGMDPSESTGADLEFPVDLEISSLRYTDGTLEIAWRKRYERWNRDNTKDRSEEIDGDLYEFRAFRQELSRAVTRFVLMPASKRAALFLQIPLGDPAHLTTRSTIASTLEPAFSWDELKSVDVSTVIKAFDEAELAATAGREPGKIIAQNTKFSAAGASVLFEADPGNSQWKNVSAVRGVRRALDAREFSGHSAIFQLQLRTTDGLDRDVTMSLNGKDKRIYLHAQMTAGEVWQVLDTVMEHSK